MAVALTLAGTLETTDSLQCPNGSELPSFRGFDPSEDTFQVRLTS